MSVQMMDGMIVLSHSFVREIAKLVAMRQHKDGSKEFQNLNLERKGVFEDQGNGKNLSIRV